MEFLEVQKRVEIFLKDYEYADFGDQKKYRMQTSDALFCAVDRIRNQKFRQATQAAISDINKPNIHVLDAGCGTGILGLFALLLGAHSCTFIEENSQTIDIAKKLLSKFDLLKKTNFITGDARTFKLDQNYDLLISETISSDFQTEDFLDIIIHLKSYANKEAKQIPVSCDLNIVEKDDQDTVISEQTVTLDLTNSIQLPESTSETKKIDYFGKIQLYSDIFIESGETMSFFNKRTISL